MIKILIIDDNKSKTDDISKTIENNKNIANIEVVKCDNGFDGKKKMIENHFDILLLDLNMPLTIGGPNIEEGGFTLLFEIVNDVRIHKPDDVIILSKYEDLLKRASKKVDISHFSQLNYDVLSDEWRDVLSSKIDYFHCLKTNNQSCSYEYDIAFITAVDIEDRELSKQFTNWTTLNISNDPTIYQTTKIITDEKEIRVVKAMQNEMGMTSAAVLTSKLITNFRPKFVVMVGISAGINKEYNLGDIIFASEMWNYSSGKYVLDDKDSKIKLLPDPRYVQVEQSIIEKSRQNFDKILSDIQSNFNYSKSILRIANGSLACGSAVVASEEVVKDYVLAHSRKTIGLDMESYGVGYACVNSQTIKPKFMVIKSICDFADESKNDSAHEYAAYTSSAFAKHFVLNYLDFD